MQTANEWGRTELTMILDAGLLQRRRRSRRALCHRLMGLVHPSRRRTLPLLVVGLAFVGLGGPPTLEESSAARAGSEWQVKAALTVTRRGST